MSAEMRFGLDRDEVAAVVLAEMAKHDGCMLACDIAAAIGVPQRGMASRLQALERRGLVRRQLVRVAASPRSDALMGWALMPAGREASTGGGR